jgi:hypothetical protein
MAVGGGGTLGLGPHERRGLRLAFRVPEICNICYLPTSGALASNLQLQLFLQVLQGLPILASTSSTSTSTVLVLIWTLLVQWY